ncbi:MAG: hypothetical protein M1838_003661 [Thelocarpon superellum]|nr:MAG: hypothetical protein M1838_003661 [Thelocarpon superellum]
MRFSLEIVLFLLARIATGSIPSPSSPTIYLDNVDSVTESGAQSFQASPPKYPSPWGSGTGGWHDAYSKARVFVSQLTLEEKVNLTSGIGYAQGNCVGNTGDVPRLNFSGFCLNDGPVGIRGADNASAFPAGLHVAATWDRRLMYDRGKAIGSEFRDKGIDVMLGPVAGPLGRSPEGGRNWEGFGPDPVLTGVAMAQTVKGIQDAGVIACAKHFIGNEQEFLRLAFEFPMSNITESYSANIDDVAMHELYLWPFADAVRAGVGGVMCALTQANNSYSCQNSYLLNHLLKDELDFQGFVVSDWGAHQSGVGGALAGMDMSMPGDGFGNGQSMWGANLTLAVVNGSVADWRIDDMATRIMAAYYQVGRDHSRVPVNFNSFTLDTYGYVHSLVGQGYQLVNQHVNVQDDHAKIIREVAAKGSVLLKNVGKTLPLDKPKNLAVVGRDAGDIPEGPNTCILNTCDTGTLPYGWGSGVGQLPYLISPLSALQQQAAADDTLLTSITDNYNLSGVTDIASKADTAIVFVNADSGEAHWPVDNNYGDRNNLTFWQNGDAVIASVAAACKNTIVVMHTVGPVLIDAFVHHPNITAIVWAGLPAQESGNAITDVLYGKTPPSGKTPFSWAAKREDFGTDIEYIPSGPTPQIDFVEGSFIDYRAMDKLNITPIFEFGFGLAYTTFEYSNLTVTPKQSDPYQPAMGVTGAAPVLGNFSTNLSDYLFPSDFPRIPLLVYPYLNNTDAAQASGDPRYGTGNGSSIPAHALDSGPQPVAPAGGAPGGNAGLYDTVYHVTATVRNTGDRQSDEVAQLYLNLGGPNDPKVVLRGFDRLSISPGDSVVFAVNLTRRDISNWDPVSQNWVVTTYPKTVFVGRSSRSLPLTQQLP